MAGIYQIIMFANVSDTFNGVTSTYATNFTFAVSVNDGCLTTSLTCNEQNIPSCIMSTQIYKIGQGNMSISFSNFTQTPTGCPGNLTYSFTVGGYTVIPSFIAMVTSPSLEIEVSTSNT